MDFFLAGVAAMWVSREKKWASSGSLPKKWMLVLPARTGQRKFDSFLPYPLG
jgi:hypothetical protein